MIYILANRNRLMTRCIVVMTVIWVTLSTSSADALEDDSTRNRFLILDVRIIASVENAKLSLGIVKKHKANPLFGEDKQWEKRFDNLYGNVIYDKEDKIYKCWYSPFIVDRSAKGMTLKERDSKKYGPGPGREMAICYATSKDGIVWEKPELGLVEYKGNKANNIIWRKPHGAGIFKDYHDSDPNRRYKMIKQGVAVSFSADGIKWSKEIRLKDIGRIAGDTHNNAFWDPESKKYVGITRTRGRRGREVTRLESDDFVRWKNTGVVLEAQDKGRQPYAMPVFCHGGVYIGLVALFGHEDRTRSGLAWSPDTKVWHHIQHGTDLIPNSEKKLEYDYGCIYPCAYPVFLKDEIRLYYGGSDYKHGGWRTGNLSLATLRPDGFAGYEQELTDKPAVITTTVIPYAGQEIRVSADVDRGGSIKVSIIDDKRQDVATARTVSKTVTDGRLKWKTKISTDKVRLKFEINKAKLYSFSYAE